MSDQITVEDFAEAVNREVELHGWTLSSHERATAGSGSARLIWRNGPRALSIFPPANEGDPVHYFLIEKGSNRSALSPIQLNASGVSTIVAILTRLH